MERSKNSERGRKPEHRGATSPSRVRTASGGRRDARDVEYRARARAAGSLLQYMYGITLYAG